MERPDQAVTISAAAAAKTLPLGEDDQANASGTIGRFVVLNVLGRGGMGLVIAAYDPQLDRRVALKLLHAEASANSTAESQARERLLREARAMAKLAHPNVVTVFEVGEVAGRGFIAMQLVEGATLRVWQTARERSWQELVTMYLAAARGIEAAHSAGLTHRDFKPENVLIGADGQPRVGDFGLVTSLVTTGTVEDTARPVSEKLTIQGSWVGTPSYMAPEQWEAKTVDARTDQFAFCVALWEAIYKELPFGSHPSPNELRAAVVSGARRPPPKSDAPSWLATVLGRGLERDPDRRWQNMRALIDELTRRSRTSRWKLATAGVAVLGAATAVTLVARSGSSDPCERAGEAMQSTWSAERARGLRQILEKVPKPYAATVAARVVDRVDGYSDAWRTMARDTCAASEVRHEQSPELLDRRTACLDARRKELGALVATLEKDPDVATLDAAAKAAYGLIPLDACADTDGLLARVPPPAPELRAQVNAIGERRANARALHQLGRYAEAAKVVDDVVRDARAVGYAPTLAEALHLSGRIKRDQDDLPTSVAQFQEAGVFAARAHADDQTAEILIELFEVVVDRQKKLEPAAALLPVVRAAVTRAGERPVLQAYLAISEGLFADSKSDYEAERKHMAEAVTLLERTLGPSYELSTALNRYGNTLTELRKFTEARAALERSLETLRTIYGDGHPKIATVLNNLGWTAQEQGDWDAAADYHQRALAIKEKALGEHSSTATSLGNLGVVRIMQGRAKEAVEILERAVAMSKKTAGPKHPNYARDLGNLASAYMELGRYAEARQAHQTALAIKLENYGEAHGSTAYALENLAALEARDHKLDAAVDLARRALAARQKALGEEHQMTGLSWGMVGELHAEQGKCDVALTELEKSVAIVDKAVGATSGDLVQPLTAQVACLIEVGRAADALAAAERATAIAKATQPTPLARANLQLALGFARWAAAGDRAVAGADVVAAAAALRSLGPSGTKGLALAEAWLAKHPEVETTTQATR